ncbi:hypothetical protein llap_5800 [Limosa lapponica baueri]|uniref:Uncharacterized protein n=1 Tax=Limosa lapponica baueri TaxID=1758121 RepID=A0A2I0UCZ9_LIMLA|nr:hypothetical protein llap_5800 [Limosa lapponica baueri]
MPTAGAVFTRAGEASASQNMVGGLGTVGTTCAHTAQRQAACPPTSTPSSLLRLESPTMHLSLSDTP